jgi:hypothetical protein
MNLDGLLIDLMQIVKFKVHFQVNFMKLHLNFGDEKNV